jgi:uncharacterized protein YegJ (DUF2314 family)
MAENGDAAHGASGGNTTRLKITSQSFKYCEYREKASQTRTIYMGRKPLQFVVNTWCDDALKDKEVEIAVEIRERGTDEPIFETFWVTSLTHTKQQSAFIFRDYPEELTTLIPGKIYTYYASALVNETDEFADRSTRATVR